MSTDRARRKLLKEARQDAKQAKRLLTKHSNKLSAETAATIRAAIGRIESIGDGDDIEALRAGLEDVLTAHLAQYRKSAGRESLESIGLAILIALFLRTFIVEAFRIPSSSMIPTLAVGDFLFVNKLAYGLRVPLTENLLLEWDEPKRGEVIVFVFPCNTAQDYIKRVVAVPGDVVYWNRQGYLWINGALQTEVTHGQYEGLDKLSGNDQASNPCPRILHGHTASLGDEHFETLHCGLPPRSDMTAPDKAVSWGAGQNYRYCGEHGGILTGGEHAPRGPLVVPQGHVFVMGDNRGNSADSRYWGFVPYGAIKGKAMFIWMSWDGAGSWSGADKPIRWGRLFKGVHGQVDAPVSPKKGGQ